MTEYSINTTEIKLTNGDLLLDAYLATPIGEGNFPGIIVLQEIFGVNSHIQDVTQRIAQQGYIAIAPALYQRQAPGYQASYTAEDIQQGRVYKEQTTASQLLGDIQSAINYLKSLPQIKPVFGCIGFCFGGHVAYLAATLADISATASFYGAGIATQTPGVGAPTLTRTKEISGTIYLFFGMEDASIPVSQVDEIEATLEQYRIPHRIFRYPGADHGFFCDRRASYNSAAATDAWSQVVRLFSEKLYI
ncbi:dienelactone hydrolase family protein [Merismopedia glauca]|uniref:Carboxymethylenebutenolidase n=1 Tax=Merismopedia glauca CCAP 1448/3 TaxID=1296344 RepID=A0A2T1BYH0_9CYAN|nr:dienelactone hydrolase family protein [Merismopedia glauca]PSB00923.1 carboxymethylenebutenolidase [Merismopedia glauca CCAP 1448/3]